MSRRPDPEYIRALKGKAPRLSKDEQLAWKSDLPLPPDFLGKEALECWDRMAAELHAAGVLFAISRDKLARYCQAYADYAEIIRARNKLGPKRLKITMYNKDEMGYMQRMVDYCNSVMKDFEVEYGLTPASATKVRRPTGAGGLTPREDMDKFLEEGKETK